MTKLTKPSPLKFPNYTNTGTPNVTLADVDADGYVVRPEINNLCPFDEVCRPVFALEKHMAVIRKGPTMPLTLEMYKYVEETADVNVVSPGAKIKASFLGSKMDGTFNYYDGMAPSSYVANTQGRADDGSDITMFHTRYKDLKIPGVDTVRIPIDIYTEGEDWQTDDQLIIEHNSLDAFGRAQKGSARVQILEPYKLRDAAVSPSNEHLDQYGNFDPADWTGCLSINNPFVGCNHAETWGDPNQTGVPERYVYAKLMSISGVFPINAVTDEDIYEVSLVQIPPLFKVKFPKFSYRYKYEDGEHSVFAPWSEIAFIPEDFDYSPKKGYNLGMENAMRSLKVLNWRPKNIPKDVVQIDILYKESNSPNIYTVESFKKDDPPEGGNPINYWDTPANGGHFGKYTIKTELIHKVVASNQLLRPWDNVPRKALGQEITANRLIFANYLQQYNLDSIDINGDKVLTKPTFSTIIESNPFEDIQLGMPAKSMKSQRTYQLGVVYRDRYGRETPVLTSKSGSVEIPKESAKLQNRLSVQLTSEPPYWAESYTFYMKETSNEYYNLAMDRWYDAEDGGIWLSFPSVERNKVNEDTNLILKKQHDSNEFTDFDVSYKILSIKNNAPKFIKTDNKYWGALPIMLPPPGWGEVGNWDSGMLYPTGLPRPQRMNIDIIAEYFDQSVLYGLTSKNSAQIRIVQAPGLPTAFNATTSQLLNKTDWYDVANISYIGAPPQTYIESIDDGSGNITEHELEIPGQEVRLLRISLEQAFGNDALFCDPGVNLATGLPSNLSLERGLILEARTREEKEKAQFEGRFFVKIHRDANVESNIIQAQSSPEDTYQVLQSKDLRYICFGHPGQQDWNNTKYVPVGRDLSNPGDRYVCEVSSYNGYAALKGAKYVDASGLTVGMPNSSPFWPFGPSSDTDGAYDTGWWNQTFEKYLDNNNDWPDVSSTQWDWPSYSVLYWNPASDWNFGGGSATAADAIAGAGVYSYLDNGLSSNLGVLDLDQANWNTNVTIPFVPTASTGHLESTNPYHLPAIWGDQSDFHQGNTETLNNNIQPKFDQNTMAKLREDWYYLWNGRDQVDPSWPLGRFHPNRWFIDKAGAAEGGSGAGIWDDGNVGYMQISFWGIGSINTYNRGSNELLVAQHHPTEMGFADALNTVGTQFRFKQDPDGVIYTITKVDVETDSVWNYEATQGGWGYDPNNAGGTTCVGASSFAGPTSCPPFGGTNRDDDNLAGGRAFLSDLYSKDKQLTGGAPYNHRFRFTLTLDKIIGQEGEHSFHPIINHVDADGIANIKGGRGKYYNSFPSGHITTAKGGTNDGVDYYNLASYWNGGQVAGDQINDINDSWYTTGLGVNAYIGLHERGLNETTIEIVSLYKGDDRDFPMSDNPAIWETEPKEDVGLDIYYAASPSYPIRLKRYRWDGEDYGIGNVTNGVIDYSTSSDTNDATSLANWYDFSYRGEEIVKVGMLAYLIGSTGECGRAIRVCGVQGDIVWFTQAFMDATCTDEVNLAPGTVIRLVWEGEGTYYGATMDQEWIELIITEAIVEVGTIATTYRVGSVDINGNNVPIVHNIRHGLGYYNCWSYGTGVETNRVRDDYNAVTIDKGVKASMPLAEQYEEERKGSGLIFSGIYNSTSGINRTNQFIQAEPITKDLNPINGSIQKLFARDTDLVTFCENKVFKILAKKDALFNADGNTNVTSNQAVLGQSIPFVGEYGISRNPESFASESYRVYFSDKDRGAVLRLSRDGLTPISDKGMRDWFKDNMRFARSIIGSFDDREDQYNLTLETGDQDGNDMAYTLSYTESRKGWVSFKSFIQQGGISHKNIYYTFPSNVYNKRNKQDPWGVNYVGGTRSNAEAYQHHLDIILKRLVVSPVNGASGVVVTDNVGTIVPGMNVEGNGIPIDTVVSGVNCNGITCTIQLNFTDGVTGVFLSANTELTFTVARNRFYDSPYNHYSMVKVMFNGAQGSVKRFKTLNYEGTQGRILLDTSINDLHTIEGVQIGQNYYDNHSKKGWYVQNLVTDMQEGKLKEFIDKENKWFNYIRGHEDAGIGDFLDTGEFSLQGLGYSNSTNPPPPPPPPPPPYEETWGCYNGVCADPMDNSGQYETEAECVADGCGVSIESWRCHPDTGCFDPGNGSGPYSTFNECTEACKERWFCDNSVEQCYTQWDDPNNGYSDNASCMADCTSGDVFGCTDPTANNYDPNATADDGSCTYDILGCTDPTATNYNSSATIDDGSCAYWSCEDCVTSSYTSSPGCCDSDADNWDPNASCDDGSCTYAWWCEDCATSPFTSQPGCCDDAATNYDPNATCGDGSCTYNNNTEGCTDPTAYNYDPNAGIDNGTCQYGDGCTEVGSWNYNSNVTVPCIGCCETCFDNNLGWSTWNITQNTNSVSPWNGEAYIRWEQSNGAYFYSSWVLLLDGAAFQTGVILGNWTSSSIDLTGLPPGTYSLTVTYGSSPNHADHTCFIGDSFQI